MPVLKNTLVLLFLWLLAATAASAKEWKTYTNEKFGYSVEYPAHIFPNVTPTDNGQGVVLSTADGIDPIRIFGVELEGKVSMESYVRLVEFQYQDRTFGVKEVSDTLVDLTGTMNWKGTESLFHIRAMPNTTGNRLAAFEFIVPKASAGGTFPLLKRMMETLTPPKPVE